MYLKTALSNIRRSPFQAFAAIFVFAVTFFVATIIAVLIYSSAQVVNYFETRPQVIAFLKSDAKDNDVSELFNTLKGDSRIKDLKFVSKDDALAIYKSATSGNPLLGQLVSPSIFPSSIEFSLKDLTKANGIIHQVQEVPIVDSVSFTASLGDTGNVADVIGKLTRITFYVRLGGLIFVSILAFTSFLVLMVIVSMRIANKKGEMDTLSLMGATASFIKTPIMLEALIYVTLGVLLGFTLGLVVILYASPTIINAFGAIEVLPKGNGVLTLHLEILGIELVIGFVIALLGGWVSLMRATSK